MENRIKKLLIKIEDNTSIVVLFLLALFPVLEIIARSFFKTGIPYSTQYILHLVIWATMIGGMITSREERHLSLGIGTGFLSDSNKKWIKSVNGMISAAIAIALFFSAFSMVFIGFDSNKMVGFFPIRSVLFVMPLSFLIIAFRFVLQTPKGIKFKSIASLGFLIGFLISVPVFYNMMMVLSENIPEWISVFSDNIVSVVDLLTFPLIIVFIVSVVFGLPIFISLGAIAVVLFTGSGGATEVITNEAYTMLTGHTIPAIPLFTLTGFILSESKSGDRLVNFFKAFFGWLPGGMAIMSILVCTFFTTFTGASGVTILALGGLLSFVLVEGKYSDKFTTGLLTSSGSIGLLFPPSLPIILYAVISHVSILDIFIGGFIPGIVMVLVLSIYSVYKAKNSKAEKIPFTFKFARKSLKEAIWEILLPIIILLGFFSGTTTISETGAISVLYSLIVTVLIHKDIPLRALPKVMYKAVPIIGGILMILAVSKGLSYYIVDAEIPMTFTQWVTTHVESKILFLILLNVMLLITGCLMDIFSAIVVVVPLIIPLGEAFGIHPVHLGIIFLANMELGYLTPPVGLNLFLSSYRFNKPLTEIYKTIIPFFIVLLVAVILITYIPSLTLFFLK